MIEEPQVLPSWTRWEKHKHRALIALAVLVSAGVAAAASNERRMFLLPSLPVAFAAIAAPEPTSLRSPILGYLNDGCQPDFDIASGSIARIVDEHDCGKGRKRSDEPAAAGRPADAPPEQPSAFFAMPDTPIDLTGAPLPVIAELAPALQTIPYFGVGPLSAPTRAASGGQPVVALEGVPEPASWAMMIGGLALAGASLRRRGRSASVEPA